MEHGARLSTSRVMAIAFIFMSVLIVLSLSVNVIQGVNNYRLQNEQRTAVTPMAFNAPFAVSQNSADASYLQQMALSFIALRLNVSSEIPACDHQPGRPWRKITRRLVSGPSDKGNPAGPGGAVFSGRCRMDGESPEDGPLCRGK